MKRSLPFLVLLFAVISLAVGSPVENSIGGFKINRMKRAATSGQNDPKWTFQPEPEVYVGSSGFATLECKAVGVNKLVFKCNDRFVPTKDALVTVETLNDQQTQLAAFLNISKSEVELQPSDSFWCQCVGFTLDVLDGNISTSRARVRVASLRKDFEQEPLSQQIQEGKDMELKCVPPQGVPAPYVTWYKMDQGIKDWKTGGHIITKGNRRYLMHNNQTFVIGRTTVEDSGNFTCVASNVIGDRQSQIVHVTIYRVGGWSSWTPFGECATEAGICGRGSRSRTRSCSNPEPKNGGAQCSGPDWEKETCAVPCPDERGWTPWTQWSLCQSSVSESTGDDRCQQSRERACTLDYPDFASGEPPSAGCIGDAFQSRPCSVNDCSPKNFRTVNPEQFTLSPEVIRRKDNQGHLYMYMSLSMVIFLIVALVIFALVCLQRQKRKSVRGMTLKHSTTLDSHKLSSRSSGSFCCCASMFCFGCFYHKSKQKSFNLQHPTFANGVPVSCTMNTMQEVSTIPMNKSQFLQNQAGCTSCYNIDIFPVQNIIPSNSHHSLPASHVNQCIPYPSGFYPTCLPPCCVPMNTAIVPQSHSNANSHNASFGSLSNVNSSLKYNAISQMNSASSLKAIDFKRHSAGRNVHDVSMLDGRSPEYEDPYFENQNEYYEYDNASQDVDLAGDRTSNVPLRSDESRKQLQRRSYCNAIEVSARKSPLLRNNSAKLFPTNQAEDSGLGGTLSVLSQNDSSRTFDYNTARGIVGAAGGRISIPDFGASLVIPPNAIENGRKPEISLTVNTTEQYGCLKRCLLDDSIRASINIPFGATLISSIVSVAPSDVSFLKPLVLTMPHFVFPKVNFEENDDGVVDDSNWTFAVIALGCLSNRSSFGHNVENIHRHEDFFVTNQCVHVITNTLAPSYCVIGYPKNTTLSSLGALPTAKRVRVAVFASKPSASYDLDELDIRIYCFPDLLEAWQAVLENEESEADNVESVLGNLVANQKLLPFKFTSSEVIHMSANKNDSLNQWSIKLEFTISECSPKSQVLNLHKLLKLESMYESLQFKYSSTVYTNVPRPQELFLNVTRNPTLERRSSTPDLNFASQTQPPKLSHIIAISIPARDKPFIPQQCVFTAQLCRDGPVFYITGSLRQRVIQALNANSTEYESLLPEMFDSNGARLLAQKLNVGVILNQSETKESMHQSDMVLNIWEVLAYRVNFSGENGLRKHFDILLDTLESINCLDLKESVRAKLITNDTKT